MMRDIQENAEHIIINSVKCEEEELKEKQVIREWFVEIGGKMRLFLISVSS